MTILALVLLGLCFGSFVNALVWRLHEQSKASKKAKKSIAKNRQDLSIIKGRSMCPHCSHILGFWDLLPLFSWLALGGKCRYCKKPISWRYPVIELLTAGIFVVSYLQWPGGPIGGYEWSIFGLWLVCLVGFVALLSYDIQWMLLPNKLVFPLFIPVVASILIESIFQAKDFQPVFGSLFGALIGGGIFYVIFQLSAGKWIGGGDVKLGFLLGLLLGGTQEAFLMLFVASLLGTLYILPLMALKRVTHKSRIPFGPFLIFAAIIVRLWGERILDWYLGVY